MARPVALVTGGSRGIGAATALRLAAEGYRLCVNYVKDSSSAEHIVERVKAESGECIAVRADVACEQDVSALFSRIDAEMGPLSLLVNNAAILRPQMPLAKMSASRINKILQTNVTGTLLCCREAIMRMSTDFAGRGGVIVNVSSIAATLGAPGEYIDYAASKGAVDTLTVGLAKEVAGQGIRVNAVRPGFIHTSMHADGGEPNRVERLSQSIPLCRGGQPEEVAAAIAWLASNESSYCTGAIIDVAGGR